MTQEDKELLLKDLCARLPYNVICTDSRHGDSRITEIDIVEETIYCDDFDEYIKIDKCKPYLRPMSNMTKGEKRELINIRPYYVNENDIVIGVQCNSFAQISECQEWLNKHHFDYRGLIEKGLAIAVTEENNPYKE